MGHKAWYVVIVGCGRLGAYLAGQLSLQGHGVVVVDSNKKAFNNLETSFTGFHLEGDATEFGVLQEAKASQADLLIATTRRDNVNLMVAQVARTVLKVPRVIARVFDPEREETYRAFGIQTVCSTTFVGDTFMLMISPEPDEPSKQDEQR